EGSIPPNVLTISNTNSNDPYQQYCREKNISGHPARMPVELASFFISFLTDENDLVLDPFAVSNTTGYAAENQKRRRVSIQPSATYVEGSFPRFHLDDEEPSGDTRDKDQPDAHS